MKSRKNNCSRHLKKLNVFFFILTVIADIITAYVTKGEKNFFTVINIYLSIALTILYSFSLSEIVKKYISDIKREILYINYSLRAGVFFAFLAILYISGFILLYAVNKDAANITFSFTFFLSLISMLFPSVLFISFIYFIIPTVFIPGMTAKDYVNKSKMKLTLILFLVLLLVILIHVCKIMYNNSTVNTREKFKTRVMNVSFSTAHLTINEKVSTYAKKLLSRNTFNIPFFYTEESFVFEDYDSAAEFCKSLNARIPNYLETYFIIFNRFDTFGENYYWTSDKDSTFDLVIHFKNMSYSLEKKPQNTNPRLYCVADIDSGVRKGRTTWLFREIKKDFAQNAKSEMQPAKNYSNNFLNRSKTSRNIINSEKKHINFSVKEVPPQEFDRLLKKGYIYSSTASISSEYETDDNILLQRIYKDPDGNEIRLCYFPFIDYTGFNTDEEKQIWSQNFCSPAFEVINKIPELKNKNDKDSFCYSQGGRLPNIAELYGILKTPGTDSVGNQYWTDNVLTDYVSGKKSYIAVYSSDGRFVKPKKVNADQNEAAFVYCIRDSKKPSRVVANYTSRFPGISGESFAGKKCPGCILYEVPDVILRK